MFIVMNADDKEGLPSVSLGEAANMCKDVIRLAEDFSANPDSCRVRLMFNGVPVLVTKKMGTADIQRDMANKYHLLSNERRDLLVRDLKEQMIYIPEIDGGGE